MKLYEISRENRMLIEQACMPFAIYQMVDQKIHILAVTKGFCDLFGYASQEEVYNNLSDNIFSYVHPDDAVRLTDAVGRFSEEEERLDMIYRTQMRGQKDYKIVHITGEHLFAANGARLSYVWYMDEGLYTQDPADQSSPMNRQLNSALHEESILQHAYYDYLTGLPSMTYFFDLAERKRKQAEKDGKTPVILYTDFTGMRYFNHKYGFEEGNALLRAYSDILTRHFDKHSCCRFGEDHFAIFATGDTIEGTVQTIFTECKEMNSGRTLPLRVGIYPDTMGLVDVSTACDRAKYACDSLPDSDTSVYAYFDRRMLENAEKRQYIINNLDRALAERWIDVYYQPIIRATSNRVSDEEALARWVDPVRGILSPADFIPLLEDAKLIYKLDLYMVDRILEKMKLQAEAGLYVVPISVNLSRTDFDCCDIVAEITKRVDDSGIGRDKLTIEVTESVVGGDFEFIKDQIDRFLALGFSVWMDDFGSGYSSLDVLQQLHVDVIKFDMHFMEQFSKNDRTRVILTELVRMARGLGMETVCEGVETRDQVNFLLEIGCTKLQGYYYNKPTPLSGILERYRKGIQIGFENPAESAYYRELGQVNLDDIMTVASEDQASIRSRLSSVSMAIIEIGHNTVTFVRCTTPYREFFENRYHMNFSGINVPINAECLGKDDNFLNAFRQSAEDGSRLLIDEHMEDGTTIHMFIRRIAVNPVKDTKALAVAILTVDDGKNENTAITYAHIARALSSDYFNLYYIDLETEEFVEYRSDAAYGKLDTERHGKDFFAASHRDVRKAIYPDDQDAFIEAFTKENVITALDEHGSFTLTYRLLINDVPTYVNLKAVRMDIDDHHIIIGVSNVDAQMRQQEALERVREEQITYTRIAALSGNFIGIYSIDPVSGAYIKYTVKPEFNRLELPQSGEDFFNEAKDISKRTIYPGDYEMFTRQFTRENVMRTIEQSGIYELRYRLLMDGKPVYVMLRAAMTQEKDGQHLIAGIVNIDERIRREHATANDLLEARNRANLDGLTGVRNQAAFEAATQHFDQMTASGQAFSVTFVIIRVNGSLEGGQKREFSDCLRIACAVICDIFKRSPVFRISDDSFAVAARGTDDECAVERMEELKNVLQSKKVDTVCGLGRHTAGNPVKNAVDEAKNACR